MAADIGEPACMGLGIDRTRAQALLADAVEWARSTRAVPQEWVQRTERIDESPSKTFTVALGTALLARTVNPEVDALALKATSSERGYSARTLAHGVLVPGALTHGYDLRATGREPMNNQPFFRYDRIDAMDRVHSGARPFLPDLIEACRAANSLSAQDAKAALAAFLRVRLQAADAKRSFVVGGAEGSLADLVQLTEDFIAPSEGGRLGQAFVAAAFDLVAERVRSIRVNDPSRRWPGDVQLLVADVPYLAIEVRQKPVNHEDALHFADSLRNRGVAVGLIAALHPHQERLDEHDVLLDAETTFEVSVTVAHGVQTVLTNAVVWGGRTVRDLLDLFPERMLRRLEEIEASDRALRRWSELFPQT